MEENENTAVEEPQEQPVEEQTAVEEPQEEPAQDDSNDDSNSEGQQDSTEEESPRSIFEDALNQVREGIDEEAEKTEPQAGKESQVDDGNQGKSEQASQSNESVNVDDLLSDVKSQRARDRIKQMVSEHNKLKQDADGIRSQNEQFTNIIRNTGMDPYDFAKTLEFCRLSRSASDADMQVALDLLEAEREAIYARMGKVAPGSDPYKGYDKIKEAVDSFEAPEWMATDYARLKRMEDQRKASVAQQQEAVRNQNEFRNRVNGFVQSATQQFQYLEKTDPNFKAKERYIAQYLQQPGVIQNIANNIPPEQWAFHMKSLYDSAQINPPRRTTPISSRSTRLSSPQVSGDTAGEIFGSALRQALGR